MQPIGLLSDHAPDEIPESHRGLTQCPPVAALTTVTPDGYPQTSVVWCDFDGQCPRVNTPQHITALPSGIPRTGYRVNKLPLAVRSAPPVQIEPSTTVVGR